MTGAMTHLFERWNAYEPNRCRFVPFAAMVKLGGIELEIAHSVTLLPVEHALLLAAVIEALAARSWEWGVSYERLDDGTYQYLAYVIRPGDKPGGTAEHTSLATALLTAYLAALETEANQ